MITSKRTKSLKDFYKQRLFWNYFGEYRLARIVPEESYSEVALVTRNIIVTIKFNISKEVIYFPVF